MNGYRLPPARHHGLLAAILASYCIAAGADIARAQCGSCPNPSFDSAARSFPVGGSALEVVVADFDRDGNADVAALVAAAGTNAPMLAVMLGTPGGHLGAATSYPFPVTYSSNFSAAVGDFDGDHLPDVVAGLGTFAIYIFRGLGDGSFESAVSIGTAQAVYRLVGGDFNGDGKPDVAYEDDWSNGTTIWIRAGNGSGGFGPAAGVPAGPGLRELAVGDLNRDGIDEIVVADGYSDSISIVTGVASGVFGPAQNFFVGPGPISVAVADWNGDGWPDIAATSGSSVVSVLWANGMGGFSEPAPIESTFSYPDRIRAGDFNGDTHPDIVVSGVYGVLFTFLGNGLGSFSAQMISGIAGRTAVGDFDRDGIADLASASRDVAILLGSSSGRFFAFYTVGGGYGVGPPIIADFDGDGRNDVLAGDVYSITTLWNDPGGFTQGMPFSTVNEVPAAAGDFNGDGKADVVATSSVYPGNQVAIYLAYGTRSFTRLGGFTVGNSPGAVLVADFNGDTKVDLAVVNYNSASVSILLGLGNGSFSPQTQFAVGTSPIAAAVADVNHDDKPDLAILRADAMVVVLLGNGTGGFVSISLLSAGTNARGLLAADVNEDDDVDLVTATAYGKTLTILAGDGNGGFGTPSNVVDLDVEIGSLSAGYVNGDSHVDLFVGWGGGFYSSGGGWLLLGNGTGQFTPSSRYFTGTGNVSTAAGDFDADGRTDFAITQGASSFNSLSLFRNTNCQARRLGVIVDVPECSEPNVAFPTQPVLQILDDGENLVSCDATPVNASIVPGTGAPGAVLGGNTAADPVSGTATFMDLSIDLAGAGYRLLFAHPTAGTTRSRSFDQGIVSVSAPVQACPYSGGHVASVPDAGPGAVYAWSLTNGVITSGVNTRSIQFKVGPSGPAVLSVTVTNADACSTSGTKTIAVALGPGCAAPIGFFTVSPCRVIDTRNADGPYGGPALPGNTTRTVVIGGQCGIPANARSVSLNLTIVAPPAPGYASLFPGNTPQPLVSTINFRSGLTRANNAIAPLGAAGDLAVFGSLEGTVHFIVDVNGYFQ